MVCTAIDLNYYMHALHDHLTGFLSIKGTIWQFSLHFFVAYDEDDLLLQIANSIRYLVG